MTEIVATTFTKTIGWFTDTETVVEVVPIEPTGYIQDLHDAAIMEGMSASISTGLARAVFYDGSKRAVIGFNPFS